MNLKGTTYRVRDHMFEHLEFKNWVRLNQVDIAAELGMSRVAVCRAIKELVDNDILFVGRREQRATEYRLNPQIAWRGKTKELHSELENASNESRMRWERAKAKAKKTGLKIIPGGAGKPKLQFKSKATATAKKKGQTDIEDFC